MLCRFFSVVLATVLALTLDAAVKLSALVLDTKHFIYLKVNWLAQILQTKVGKKKVLFKNYDDKNSKPPIIFLGF